MSSDKFILFSNCIPVKGANRSVICDMQNNRYYFIPKGLYDILEAYNGKTIAFVKKEFDNKYDEIIDEYFEFLASKKLIFFHANPDLFPRISLKWDSPSSITNIIIDYDTIEHDFKNIIQQLEALKCSHMQVRFFKRTHLHFITHLAELLNKEQSRIVSIDFIVPYSDEFSKNTLDSILKKNPRIHAIILFNAPYEKSHEALRDKMGYLMFIKKNILSEKHCGVINKEYFYSNMKLFTESLHYNSCLNRKISIDSKGNIKNCPSMAQSFGNSKDTTLEEALNHKDFKKYWNITKDQVAVCKDCEFRYICTDCRAYTENPEDRYSKPLKCGYDPYTNTWEEWSTNLLKQKAIEFYDMKNIV